MTPSRVRTVQGSCLPCKKRRIKCDLVKPKCLRCSAIGAECDYSQVRWAKSRVEGVPAAYQISNCSGLPENSLGAQEKRALNYFQGRLWPLLTTTESHCRAPMMLALEHRVVLVTACTIADAHRLLQDGRAGRADRESKLVYSLSLVRSHVITCPRDDNQQMMILLFAVLLLYLHDGLLECIKETASTHCHRLGVLAIVHQLGGIDKVLSTAWDSLELLLSEFVSADLTSAMLRNRAPVFQPGVWDSFTHVWWNQDSEKRCSLSAVFQIMTSMALYAETLAVEQESLSLEQIRKYEDALRPTYMPIAWQSLDNTPSQNETSYAFALVRAFQHSGLIYLYRRLCRLQADDELVQQHVHACLSSIFSIDTHHKVVNCMIFPIYVASAHVTDRVLQFKVLDLIEVIYDKTRLSSYHSVSASLSGVWKNEFHSMSWNEMFGGLGSQAIII